LIHKCLTWIVIINRPNWRLSNNLIILKLVYTRILPRQRYIMIKWRFLIFIHKVSNNWSILITGISIWSCQFLQTLLRAEFLETFLPTFFYRRILFLVKFFQVWFHLINFGSVTIHIINSRSLRFFLKLRQMMILLLLIQRTGRFLELYHFIRSR
jgi:hypothetical protein